MVRLDNNLVLYFLTVTPLPHVISNVYRLGLYKCGACLVSVFGHCTDKRPSYVACKFVDTPRIANI